MYRNSLNAYQMVENATISGRATEARVLSKAALKLKYCRDNWEAANRHEKMDEALTYTQHVLKENVLSLSAFIDKRIFHLMAEPAPEKLNIIIDIHLSLATGLRESASQGKD